MRIALLHRRTLSELFEKMSDQEYLLWAAYLNLQTDWIPDGENGFVDVEEPDADTQEANPSDADDTFNQVYQVMRM